jgi:hypothetical protein
MATSAFDEFVEEYHQALDEFFRGSPMPAQALYSHREDATLANPFGPIAKGWAQIAETMERAAANYRDGGASGFDTAAVVHRHADPITTARSAESVIQRVS